MGGECHKLEIRNAYKILVLNPKGNEPLWRRRHARHVESEIFKCILTGWKDVNRVNLAQDIAYYRVAINYMKNLLAP
jgi:hypothetical protein